MVDIKVGMTDCNADRNIREIWIKNLMVRFTTNISKETEGAILTPIIFFQEAIGCYQNGNFVACISMCGASVESLLVELLLYNYKKTIKDSSGSSFAWSYEQEFKDGKFRDYLREFVSSDKNRFKRRKDIIKKLRHDKRLDKIISEKITTILDQRDQVMHYSENTWRRFFENAGKFTIGESFFWPFNESQAKCILESSLDALSYASTKFMIIAQRATNI